MPNRALTDPSGCGGPASLAADVTNQEFGRDAHPVSPVVCQAGSFGLP